MGGDTIIPFWQKVVVVVLVNQLKGWKVKEDISCWVDNWWNGLAEFWWVN